MNYNAFASVEACVYMVLSKSPDTRDNDDLLYLTICKALRPEIKNMSYEEVILRLNELGLPKRNTVERARRKVQANFKQLKPSKETTERRYMRFKEALEYATE